MPQNLFAACGSPGALVAKRIPLSSGVQKELEQLFYQQETEFRAGVTAEVAFDGSWKPDEDEFLTINVNGDASVLVSAITANPLSITALDVGNFLNAGIKALFTGTVSNGSSKILVQKFSSQQLLYRKYSLLQDGNRFRRLSEPAFSLENSLSAIIEDGIVKFKSFHNVRTFIYMVNLYKTATDQEIQQFASHHTLDVRDVAKLLSQADQISRKLIHAILASGTLDDYSVNDIVNAGAGVGIPITVEKGKILVPESRAELKILLRFLDDGLYEAPLSKQRYVTNSKRRLS